MTNNTRLKLANIKIHNSKEHLRLYLINLIAGFICYVSLFSNGLVNQYDGLYVPSRFYAGSGNGWHEILIGRWFWPVLDRIRYGYAGDPFQSYLSLAIISIGNVIFLDFFSAIEKKRAYLISIFLQTSTVVCVCLSYRYMSPTFALAYTLAVASARCSIVRTTERKSLVLWMALSVVFCVLSLGLFQADLGCICLLMAAWIIMLCLDEKSSIRDVFSYIGKCAVILVVGMVLYKLAWDFSMFITGTELTSYEGVDTVTVGNILRSLPAGIAECNRMTAMYFFGDSIKYSIFQPGRIHQAMMVLTAVLFLWILMRLLRKDIRKALIVVCVILLLPMALIVYNLLAPDYGMILIHMTAPLMMLFPVTILICMREAWCPHRLARYCCILLLVLGVYGNIYQTAVDLMVMQESTKASETLMANVVHSLIDKDVYSMDRQYAFIGRPSDNTMYQKSKLWIGANDYARVGEFWISTEGLAMDTVTDCIRMDYYGLLRNLGIELTICPDDVYDDLKVRDEVRNMPLYPAEGSMKEIDGVYVIKISNAW